MPPPPTAALIAGKSLAEQLIPIGQARLARILRERRDTLWGDSQVLFRVRKYPKSKTE